MEEIVGTQHYKRRENGLTKKKVNPEKYMQMLKRIKKIIHIDLLFQLKELLLRL